MTKDRLHLFLWYAIQYKTQEAKTHVPTHNIEILRLLTVLFKKIY